MSRIGHKTISLPDKAGLKMQGKKVTVEGPKGTLDFTLPEGIEVAVENAVVTCKRRDETREMRAMHGTVRAIINNMVIGVTKGYVKELEIQGVGMRAAVSGDNLDLSLGQSHPLLHPIPKGVSVAVNEGVKLTISGTDKQLIGNFAADVRRYYRPEPYKGKGIRYANEKVRRKEGKSASK